MSKHDAFAQLGLTEEQFFDIYREMSISDRGRLLAIFWKCNRSESGESRELRQGLLSESEK